MSQIFGAVTINFHWVLDIYNQYFQGLSLTIPYGNSKDRYQELKDLQKPKSRQRQDDNNDNKKCNIKRRRAVATAMPV